MGLGRLLRLSKLKRVSEYSVESLITDFGMYESAIINLCPIEVYESEEPCILVGDDVRTIQILLSANESRLLPCPDCKRKLAFTPENWGNPRNMDKSIRLMSTPPIYNGEKTFAGPKASYKMNVSEFRLNIDVMYRFTDEDFLCMKHEQYREALKQECIVQCRKYLLENASEIRRDYICTLDSLHRIFVNFRIYNPITSEDFEEYRKQLEMGVSEETKAFEYLRESLIIQKVGQYPSIADLQMLDVEKYRKILERESYRDLTRAIGLDADGIGSGSLLYLRRVFEKLVEEVHQEEATKEGWDEVVYKKARFDDRLRILEGKGRYIVPEVLKNVKNKIYGNLSKGVHESTEDECRELFPYLLFAIEQIMDEKIRKKEMDRKIGELQKKLNSV